MSTYNSLISAGNVDLRPEFLNEIFTAAAEQSVVLSKARQLRNMTTKELKLKVSTALPTVYFVGEKGLSQTFPSDALKQTTSSEWEDVSIYAGELAAIIVVPNSVIADANFDIFAEIKNQMPTAIAQKVDSAVLYGDSGTDVPDDWSDGIFVAMPNDHKIALGTGADLYDDILAASGVYAAVEADHYDVNGVVADVTLKASLRGLRDNVTGLPIFVQTVQEAPVYSLAGVSMTFPMNGAFDPSQTLLVAGDWSKLVYSLRQDVAFDMFNTGVIQDGNGAIQHNLMQEDLTAIRCTFRMAWGLPQAAQWATISGAYPFAALVP